MTSGFPHKLLSSAKLLLNLLQVPVPQRDYIFDNLPDTEQDKISAVTLRGQGPEAGLKWLKKWTKEDPQMTLDIIRHLDKQTLRTFARAGLKDTALAANLSKLSKKELIQLLLLLSSPKDIILIVAFFKSLEPARRQFLIDHIYSVQDD